MTKKRSNKTFFMGIAVAFLLPLSFYVIAKLLKKDKINMPRYYIAERVDSQQVNGVWQRDTLFHRVSDIQLVNQLGSTVSIHKDLEGKIRVVNFFFTACPIVCPQLTGNLKMLQRAFRKDPQKAFRIGNEIQFLSISVDPERDSVPILRRYADRFDVDHDRWWFLTGDRKTIYNFARKELLVSMQPGDGGAEDFIHSEKIVLIDQQGYIRGYYNGLDTSDISRCADDIALLTMAKKRK